MLFIIDLRPGGFRNNKASQDASIRTEDQFAATARGQHTEESISLPQVPLESDGPIHSAQSIATKFRPTTIEDTRIVTQILEMTSALDGSAGAENHHVCKVTLTGPSGPTPAFSVLNPKTWRSSSSDMQIELEMRVGSEECPNWDHVNKCLTAIRQLVTIQDGYLNEAVTAALTQHMGARILTPAAQSAN
jgi:hypothetical protein